MPGADVLYSDVVFTQTKENTRETYDTTYSEINVLKSQPLAEQSDTGFQCEASNRRSKVTARATLLLLCVLLAAAVAGLGIVSSDNFQTKKNLQTIKQEMKALSAKPCPTCEPDWEQHGGSCYHFSISKQTWNLSRRDCKGRGADLVQIDSEEEQRFLDFRVRGKMDQIYDRFWIGLTDAKEEGRWLWVDDSPLDTSWSYWNKTEPDNWTREDLAGEDCVNMGVKDGAEGLKCWFDRTCNAELKHVCEKPAESGRR